MLKNYKPALASEINTISLSLTHDGQLKSYRVGHTVQPFRGAVVRVKLCLVYHKGPPHHLIASDYGLQELEVECLDGRSGQPKALTRAQIDRLVGRKWGYGGHSLHFFGFQFEDGKTHWKTPVRPNAGEEWRQL